MEGRLVQAGKAAGSRRQVPMPEGFAVFGAPSMTDCRRRPPRLRRRIGTLESSKNAILSEFVAGTIR
jgi:hypothetical protein